jgi:hypothetical protein
MSKAKNDQSSQSQSSEIEAVKKEADDLVKDLLKIVDKNLALYMPRQMHIDLIQDLCIYIAERDTKVMIHGINLGGKL